MGTGPTVEQYHFDGWDLPTKYGWMHAGPGVSAATSAQDAVREMAERLIASGERVRGLLSGAEWSGAAAVAAGEAMRRGAEQITQSAAGAISADRCVTELGESFSAAQCRVPAPNEVPSDLADRFLYGAAEGFNAVSPFDVQSPLHTAMAQRRELDQQANLALTEHMTTSRERLEAMPTVTAPAPMTVTPQGAAPSGAVGTAPAVGAAATGYAPAPAPAATHPVGWAAMTPVPAVSSRASGERPRAAPLPPQVAARTSPAVTAGPTAGWAAKPPATTLPAAFRTGATGGTGVGGTGVGGTGVGGTVAGGALGASRDERRSGQGAGYLGGARSAGGARTGGAGRADNPGPGRSNASSFLQPPIGGRTPGDGDTEHRDRYATPADHIVGELPLVAPAVLGETPEDEDRRLRRDGR